MAVSKALVSAGKGALMGAGAGSAMGFLLYARDRRKDHRRRNLMFNPEGSRRAVTVDILDPTLLEEKTAESAYDKRMNMLAGNMGFFYAAATTPFVIKTILQNRDSEKRLRKAKAFYMHSLKHPNAGLPAPGTQEAAALSRLSGLVPADDTKGTKVPDVDVMKDDALGAYLDNPDPKRLNFDNALTAIESQFSQKKKAAGEKQAFWNLAPNGGALDNALALGVLGGLGSTVLVKQYLDAKFPDEIEKAWKNVKKPYKTVLRRYNITPDGKLITAPTTALDWDRPEKSARVKLAMVKYAMVKTAEAGEEMFEKVAADPNRFIDDVSKYYGPDNNPLHGYFNEERKLLPLLDQGFSHVGQTAGWTPEQQMKNQIAAAAKAGTGGNAESMERFFADNGLHDGIMWAGTRQMDEMVRDRAWDAGNRSRAFREYMLNSMHEAAKGGKPGGFGFAKNYISYLIQHKVVPALHGMYTKNGWAVPEWLQKRHEQYQADVFRNDDQMKELASRNTSGIKVTGQAPAQEAAAKAEAARAQAAQAKAQQEAAQTAYIGATRAQAPDAHNSADMVSEAARNGIGLGHMDGPTYAADVDRHREIIKNTPAPHPVNQPKPGVINPLDKYVNLSAGSVGEFKPALSKLAAPPQKPVTAEPTMMDGPVTKPAPEGQQPIPVTATVDTGTNALNKTTQTEKANSVDIGRLSMLYKVARARQFVKKAQDKGLGTSPAQSNNTNASVLQSYNDKRLSAQRMESSTDQTANQTSILDTTATAQPAQVASKPQPAPITKVEKEPNAWDMNARATPNPSTTVKPPLTLAGKPLQGPAADMFAFNKTDD